MAMTTAVVGGGAAGFFLAVSLKEMVPGMAVTIFERSQHVLAKVLISGGGRCNCTNTFADVTDLSQVYPRGHRLLKRLFRTFGPADAYRWFQQHGVPLTTQADQCVFPASQDAHSIADCFTRLAHQYGISVRTGEPVGSLSQLSEFDFVAVTTGGAPRPGMLSWLAESGVELVPPVPSLFTFSIADADLCALMGTVVPSVTAALPGTSFRANGPLLVTHWGMSGPAILKLSSHAARHLHQQDYRCPLSINWSQQNEAQVAQLLADARQSVPQRQVATVPQLGLPQRLWAYLVQKSLREKGQCRWHELGRKDVNRLVNTLTNDLYQIAGKGTFRDEFVTCGGVSLQSVQPATLECRTRPRLFFAGEVLDIDGVTGGFNFQAAWTTAYTVAQAIARQS